MSAISNLKHSIKLQNKIIGELLEGTKHLTLVKEKSKSPQVRDAIDMITEKVEELHTNKSSLHGAFYEVEKTGVRTTTERKPSEPQPDQSDKNHDKQEAILKACEALAVSLAKQQEDINEIKHTHHTSRPSYASKAGAKRDTPRAQAPLPSTNPEPGDPDQEHLTGTEEWRVVNTKRPRKPRDTSSSDNKKSTQASNKRPRRAPPDAIAIKPGTNHSFADILKAVRKEVDVDKTGAHITSIAESRGGELLIKVTRDEAKRSGLESAIRDALGDRATVRGLVSYVDLDITGLDSVTTDSEIADALKRTAGLPATDTSIKVRNVRPAPNGTRRATASIKRIDYQSISRAGNIRIGLVWAKVRLRERVVRCYKCLGFGHVMSKCTGLDRRDACSLCATTGHRAAECNNSPRCVACEDVKAPTDHYPGSSRCTSYRKAQAQGEQATRSLARSSPQT